MKTWKYPSLLLLLLVCHLSAKEKVAIPSPTETSVTAIWQPVPRVKVEKCFSQVRVNEAQQELLLHNGSYCLLAWPVNAVTEVFYCKAQRYQSIPLQTPPWATSLSSLRVAGDRYLVFVGTLLAAMISATGKAPYRGLQILIIPATALAVMASWWLFHDTFIVTTALDAGAYFYHNSVSGFLVLAGTSATFASLFAAVYFQFPAFFWVPLSHWMNQEWFEGMSWGW